MMHEGRWSRLMPEQYHSKARRIEDVPVGAAVARPLQGFEGLQCWGICGHQIASARRRRCIFKPLQNKRCCRLHSHLEKEAQKLAAQEEAHA
jgi:hypothetical protein